MRKYLLIVLAVLMITTSAFAADDTTVVSDTNDISVDEETGHISFQNGIFLRHYDNYSEDAQVYLSALDSCYLTIPLYAKIIDPYANGEKQFDDDQWSVIYTEVKYMNGFACSYVMQNPVPEELKDHESDIFYAAYHLMIANDLMMNSLQLESPEAAALANYYSKLAEQSLEWWEIETGKDTETATDSSTNTDDTEAVSDTAKK